MGWRIDGSQGRWLAYNAGSWTGDDETRLLVRQHIDGPIPTVEPSGPPYQPTGPDDEIAVWLLATRFVPGPNRSVTGSPPSTGHLAVSGVEDVVY